MQCEAREDYYRRMRANERRYKQVNEELADAKAALSNAESTITEMQSAITALQAEIERLTNERKS
jgi:peptidoglycan hydrolase CwlO-like protein